MNRTVTSQLFLSLSAFLLCALPAPVRAQSDTPAGSAAIKSVPQRHVFYLDFTGRYWAVGSQFREVRAFTLEHDISGPMFCRYRSGSAQNDAEEIVAQVGVILESPLSASEPFKSATWPEGEVAILVLDGARRPGAEVFRQLAAWAREQGRSPTGDAVAVYHGGRATGGEPFTEVQIELEPAVGTGSINGPTIDEPEVPEPRAILAREDDRRRLHELRGLSSAELLDQQRWDDLALLLVPEKSHWHEWEVMWLEAVHFRLGAVGRVLNESDPGEGTPYVMLAAALRARAKSVLAGNGLASLSQRVTRLGSASATRSEGAQTVIDRLDALVGRLAMGLLDSSSVDASASRILDAARQVLER